MKTTLAFAALIAFAAAIAVHPAQAQQAGPPGQSNGGGGSTLSMPGMDLGGTERHYTAEEKEKFKEIDNNYKKTMEKVPDKKTSSDPWSNMR